MEATNAPIEPFDGFFSEGGVGFDRRDGAEACFLSPVTAGVRGEASAALGSRPAMAFSKPAQPSWLSTAFGS